MGRVNADLVVALVAGGIGIVTLVLIPFQIAGESIAAIGNLQSPAFFPVFSGIAIIICAGILAVRSLAATATGGLHVTFPRLPFVAAVSGIFVLFAAGSLVIGMIPASAVMIFVLAYLWDYRDFRILVPVAVLVPLAIYLLFEKTLLIILPRGVVFG